MKHLESVEFHLVQKKNLLLLKNIVVITISLTWRKNPLRLKMTAMVIFKIFLKINILLLKSSNRLNGTCNSRDKSLTCCQSTFSSSKSHQCYDKVNMGHSSNKSDRGQNVVPHQQCSTLFKTHRLREKNQYEELLQNFFPRRIDVICDKREDKRSRQKPIEVIDLDKSGSSSPFPKTQPAFRKHDRTLQMHWTIPIREKKAGK